MAGDRSRTGRREQVNVSVDDSTLLVLRTAATRDGVSVSELLRPIVERYARNRLKDEDLKLAVEALLASRQRDAERRARRSGVASVRHIDEKPVKPRRSPAPDTARHSE